MVNTLALVIPVMTASPKYVPPPPTTPNLMTSPVLAAPTVPN